MRKITEVNDVLLNDSNQSNDNCEILVDEKPDFISNDTLIKKIPPAKWDGLIGILEFLTKDSDDSVIIKESTIMYSIKGGAIIKVDLSEIFDNEKIDLHISSPKKWTRLFKTIKNSNIYIIDDENKFIVTDGQIKLFLPKQVNSYIHSLEFPNFSDTETVCDLILQKESRDTILKLGKDISYIELLLQENQLKCVNIPNTAIFVLPEFLKDSAAQKLTNTTADLTLRSQVFLPYSADTYKILIGKNLISDSYFIYSTCSSNLITIDLYEQLDNSTGIDQLF